jgi:hypothetical protein
VTLFDEYIKFLFTLEKNSLLNLGLDPDLHTMNADPETCNNTESDLFAVKHTHVAL